MDHGFILIDKPENWTCQQVLRRIKPLFKKQLAQNQIDSTQSLKKSLTLGYLGTLDPFATGLLPILFGGCNRLVSYAHDMPKTYYFHVRLGSETDTLDPTGTVTHTDSEFNLQSLESSLQKIDSLIKAFTGDITQIPPAYSALKMNGVPLYAHMRSTGSLPQSLEIKKRNIHIYSLEYLGIHEQDLIFQVKCSQGTYIRSLARDFAHFLGTYGHCSLLKRVEIGPWNVSNAFALEDLSSIPPLNSWDTLLPDKLYLNLPSDFYSHFQNGKPIPKDLITHLLPDTTDDSDIIFAKCHDMAFICTQNTDALLLKRMIY